MQYTTWIRTKAKNSDYSSQLIQTLHNYFRDITINRNNIVLPVKQVVQRVRFTVDRKLQGRNCNQADDKQVSLDVCACVIISLPCSGIYWWLRLLVKEHTLKNISFLNKTESKQIRESRKTTLMKQNLCVPFWNPAFQSQNLPFSQTPAACWRSCSKIKRYSVRNSIAKKRTQAIGLWCKCMCAKDVKRLPPHSEPLCCWAPAPEPSESSDWPPWRFLKTGGTCLHVDAPVGQTNSFPLGLCCALVTFKTRNEDNAPAWQSIHTDLHETVVQTHGLLGIR